MHMKRMQTSPQTSSVITMTSEALAIWESFADMQIAHRNDDDHMNELITSDDDDHVKESMYQARAQHTSKRTNKTSRQQDIARTGVHDVANHQKHSQPRNQTEDQNKRNNHNQEHGEMWLMVIVHGKRREDDS